MFSQVMHKSYTDKEVIVIFIGINMVNLHLSVSAPIRGTSTANRHRFASSNRRSPKCVSPRSIGFAQYCERPCVHRFPMISIIHLMQNLTSLVSHGSFLLFSYNRFNCLNLKSVSVQRNAAHININQSNKLHIHPVAAATNCINLSQQNPLCRHFQYSIIQLFEKNTYTGGQRTAKHCVKNMGLRVYNSIDLWCFAESISFRFIKTVIQFYSNHEPNRFNSLCFSGNC